MRRKLLNFKRSSSAEDAPATEYGVPIDMTDGSKAALQAIDGEERVVATGSVFDSVLSQELLAPSVATAEAPPAPAASSETAPSLDNLIVESSIERDLLRSEMADRVDASETPVDQVQAAVAGGELSVDRLFDASTDRAPLEVPLLAAKPSALVAPAASAFPDLSFWDRYDEATASAELFAVPPAAITAIVGALHVAAPVAERCRASHWVTECDVYVLTSRPELVEDPSWKILKRPSDVVALLDDGLSDFPLIVVDIPRELPTWIRPLSSRLRSGGVGLVRYVLDDDPSDEDLATWHGELGRPSVLDLVAAVPPARVLDLLDRGEPVASVGGMPITADLLMALRLSV